MKLWAGLAAPLAAVTVALSLSSPGGSAADLPQTCDVSIYPLSTPTSRFEDNGDGTVTDKQSKLMWMRCAIGQTWVKGTCSGTPTALKWQAAVDAAQALNKRGSLFFNDWRLPQVPELAGIAERQCKNPRINLTVFPATPSAPFWTATSRPSTSGASASVEASAFVLGFGADGVRYASKEETHHVRLVRSTP